MPRTKKTERESIELAGEITVINESSQAIFLGLDELVLYVQRQQSHNPVSVCASDLRGLLLKSYRQRKPVVTEQSTSSSSRSTSWANVEMDAGPGQSMVIPLPTYKQNLLTTWFLVLQKHGVLWHPETCTTRQRLSDDDDDDDDDDNNHEDEDDDNEEEEEELEMVSVLPGGTYRSVDNLRNPVLTKAQFQTISYKAVVLLQQSTIRYSQLWEAIYNNIAQDIRAERTVSELIEAYNGYNKDNRQIRLPHWPHVYEAVQRKIVTKNSTISHNHQSISDNCHLQHLQLLHFYKALEPIGSARIEVYFRALDRQPGGNDDCHTIGYIFDCTTLTVRARCDACYDNGERERNQFIPKRLSMSIAAAAAAGRNSSSSSNDNVHDHQDGSRLFLEFLSALRDLGPSDSEYTVVDPAQDFSSYDTLWTSQEILVYVPRRWSSANHHCFPFDFRAMVRQVLLCNQRGTVLGGKLPLSLMYQILEYAAPSDEFELVTRLHQRSVPSEHWYNERNVSPSSPHPPPPPNDNQHNAMEAAMKLIGMGARPNTWSDAGDGTNPCPARQDERMEQVLETSSTNISALFQPIYYNS